MSVRTAVDWTLIPGQLQTEGEREKPKDTKKEEPGMMGRFQSHGNQKVLGPEVEGVMSIFKCNRDVQSSSKVKTEKFWLSLAICPQWSYQELLEKHGGDGSQKAGGEDRRQREGVYKDYVFKIIWMKKGKQIGK